MNVFVVLSCLVVFISILNTPLIFSHGVETISGNKYITQATTISSPNRIFELGFFTGQSSNYYIGIWYKNISPQTVVWVANRVTPIPSSAINSSKLRVLDGNLVLVDWAQNLLWSTNLSVTTVKQNSVLATLRDSGNLVLIDDGINSSTTPLWQSFDHPTETFLPGSKFGYNKRTKTTYGLTSWKSWDDPAPGLFSIESDGNMAFQLWNGTEEYWNSGPKFGTGDMQPTYAAFNYTVVDNENETYLTYDMLHPSVLSRLIIDVNGQHKVLTWSEASQEWMRTYNQPPQECDVYAYCGPFGFCNDNSTTVCVCLQGFKYNSEKEWRLNEFSGGCVRNTSLKCGSNYQEEDMDRFIMYPNVRLPRHPQNITTQTRAECESTCLKNCSCTAYAYSNSRGHCWIWVGQLLNLKQLGEDDINQSTIYVRLSAPEFSNIKDTNSKQLPGKLKAIIASVAVAAAALLACTIFCFWYKRRRAALKITELAVDAIMDEMIDEDTDGVPFITFQSILEATNNFSDANKLGEGGFGPVYKGMLFDGQEIAIKRLSSQSSQGINEFKNEVVLIGKLQHRNLVKLAWKLWKEGNAMDLLDDSVLVECCKESEVLKCINVGLLCVEEDPNRRPSMPNVFLMLTDESMDLPKPNQPAFVTRNWICKDFSTVESDKPCSNQLTFSTQEGRYTHIRSGIEPEFSGNSSSQREFTYHLSYGLWITLSDLPHTTFTIPGESPNYYAGIWYKNISPQTTIWVANRATPIPPSTINSTKLTILHGNLVLLDAAAQNSVWSTNITAPLNLSPVLAALRDDGNLILSHDGINSTAPIWQSFDHPTNTFVPGSKVGYNKRTKTKQVFTSWKNRDDPAPGLFSFFYVPNESHQVWNGTEIYWNSATIVGNGNSSLTVKAYRQRLDPAFNFTIVDNENETFCFTISRKSETEWGLNEFFLGGCVRNTSLKCGISYQEEDIDRFRAYPNVRLPRHPQNTTTKNQAEWEEDGNGSTIYIRFASPSEFSNQRGTNSKFKAIIPSVAVAAAALLGCSICYICYRRRRTKHAIMDQSIDEDTDEEKVIGVQFFSLQSILEATDNFSEANKLGKGGFGIVYKGVFFGGQEIAVKRLSSESGQGINEFKNEVALIAKLQHRNLVKLVGYCTQAKEKILVYEYMPNKSLDTFIFVWVANRVAPVPSAAISAAKLRILDGNLVIVDGAGNFVWSTNITATVKQSSVVATLGDDGNLVLSDGSKKVTKPTLWQSFDHPTDTNLAGSKFGYNKRTKTTFGLTAWKSSDDPAPGPYSIFYVPTEILHVWNGTESYGAGLRKFANGTLVAFRPNPVINFTLVDNENETYFTYFLLDQSIIARHTIDIDGREKELTWSETAKTWMATYVNPKNQCDVYAYCGPFGICSENSVPVCDCLHGFRRKSETEWGISEFFGGCLRNTSLKCGVNYQEEDMDRFRTYPNVRLPRHPQNTTAKNQAECESTCLRNCSCTAYAYDDSNGRCSVWAGELLDLKQFGKDEVGNESTIYIRLAASEFPNIKETSSKHWKLEAIIASLAVAATALLACSICYVCYKKRRTTLKITVLQCPFNFLGFFISPSMAPCPIREADEEFCAKKWESLFIDREGKA
nr:G-type lectin S-receptor-like serine/threonine-protein kinase At4g27290 isoform X1 [Ipomoea batatas]